MKVVVADDQLIFAEAAAALLARNGHDVLGCAANGEDVIAAAASEAPDVVLVGLDADGERCAVIAELAAAGIGAPLVAMSETADAALLGYALEAGADAVFLKTEGIEELERLLGELSTVTAATPGQKRWSRGASAAARRSTGITGVPSVTPREREVLARLSRGESTSRIAASLDVGTATVRTHVQNLFYKFGTHSRLELLAQARRAGLLSSVTEHARVQLAPARFAGAMGATPPARNGATPLARNGATPPARNGATPLARNDGTRSDGAAGLGREQAEPGGRASA